MAIYRWNAEKNLLLKEARGVSFEQVVMHIERGDLLDVIAHPNSERYPNQKVLILNISACSAAWMCAIWASWGF